MDSIRISIVQTDIVWENKQENLRLLHEKLQSLRGTTEIVVLPEMFSTGFSMQSDMLAEANSGETITALKQWASLFQVAICGSYITVDNGRYYNRAFFLTPEGEEFYYDKRHLFRMGREAEHFSAGDERLIIPYRGWNICLLVCYDLRFPVWSRNVANQYDLLIYVANWPIPPPSGMGYTASCPCLGKSVLRMRGQQSRYRRISSEIQRRKQNLFSARRRSGLRARRNGGHSNCYASSDRTSSVQRKVSGMERCRRIPTPPFVIKQMLKTI